MRCSHLWIPQQPCVSTSNSGNIFSIPPCFQVPTLQQHRCPHNMRLGTTTVASSAFSLARRRSLGQLTRPSLRSWSQLFCATSSQQQQLLQQHELNKNDVLHDPLVHSNPKIQTLLDRYSNVCQQVPELPASAVMIEEEQAERATTSRGRGRGEEWRGTNQTPSRAVFSNNLVDLSRIEVVGFDYDYTLATCKQNNEIQAE